MDHFIYLISQLIDSAQQELEQAKQSGKVANTVVSETHFLSAWITTALKNKRFNSILVPLLKDWQKQLRSLGKNSNLLASFKSFATTYQQITDQNNQPHPVNKLQIENLLDILEEHNWLVIDDAVIENNMRCRSDGQPSALICAEQLSSQFVQQVLKKPISLYIRGEQKQLVKSALDCGLLLYKVTDYKSKVKYHGEYKIYPFNSCNALPELG